MPNELETLREALEAKCALYAASLKQADARVAELERIAGSDPTTATRDDLRRWTAQQHDEIRELRAERDQLKRELDALRESERLLDGEFSEMLAERDEARRERDAMHRRFNDALEATVRLEAERDALAAKVERLASRGIEDLRHENAELRAALAETRRRTLDLVREELLGKASTYQTWSFVQISDELHRINRLIHTPEEKPE